MPGGRVTEPNQATSEGDLERLADRVAMLAAEDGEADNAGRAVGALARRIGLTGGDLKRIFLVGAASSGAETAALREHVDSLDAERRALAWERDVLRAENGKLLDRVRRLRATLQGCAAAAGGVLAVALLAGGIAWVGHAGRSAPAEPPPPVASPAGAQRTALVRPGGALLFRQPERVGPAIALPGGQRLTIRRLVWKSLFQWAEVETPDGGVGYVLTTEIDLS
jgi:hypothetical protein